MFFYIISINSNAVKCLILKPPPEMGGGEYYAKIALWNTFLPLRILTPSFSISSEMAN